jgi:hypothetical protein
MTFTPLTTLPISIGFLLPNDNKQKHKGSDTLKSPED